MSWLVALLLVLCGQVAAAATITVCASGCDQSNLQTAIDAAACGDSLHLTEGETYTGAFVLPDLSGCATPTVIRSRRSDILFPLSGGRITPAHAADLPIVVSSGGGEPAIKTAVGGARYWTLRFLKIAAVPQGFGAMVQIGHADSNQTLRAHQPDHIAVDRVWLKGDDVFGQKRAVEFHGTNISITGNYMEEITSVGQDSQCISGWNGYGPVTITNNYLECATENIMFGGADPTLQTIMTITSPSTTGGDVAVTNGSNLAELRVGQDIAITTAAGVQHSIIATITGTGSSGSLTWSPAIANTPSTPGELRAGVVLDGATIERNVIVKDPDWKYGVLRPPTMGSPSTSTASGSLAAGTYYYTFVSTNPDGYQGQDVNSGGSTEVSATLGATGTITIPYTDAEGSVGTVIWRGTAPGVYDGFVGWPFGTHPFVDDGTLSWTAFPDVPMPTQYQVKNLFEIKAAKDVTMRYNILRYSWQGSDVGTMLWAKSTNQDGNCWYCKSENFLFELNRVEHVYGFFLINGHEAYGGVEPAPFTGVTIRNVLVCDSGPTWSTSGSSGRYAMAISNGVTDMVVDHVTVDHEGSGLLNVEEGSSFNVTFRNSMLRSEEFNIHDDTGSGEDALNAAFDPWVFTSNAVADGTGGGGANFPAGNLFAALVDWKAAFTGHQDDCSGDYSIATGHAYKAAGTDGGDLGVNMVQLTAALVGVADGAPIVTATGPSRMRFRIAQ